MEIKAGSGNDVSKFFFIYVLHMPVTGPHRGKKINHGAY